MKNIVLIACLVFCGFIPGPGLYTQMFDCMDGSLLRLASIHGKKLLVVEVNAAAPDNDLLLKLNTINSQYHESLTIVAVPALDFGEPLTIEQLGRKLFDTLHIEYFVTYPGFVKKVASPNQHQLFKWLTHASENKHFDRDILEPNEMFVISEKGRLFASFTATTPDSLIQNIIERVIPE